MASRNPLDPVNRASLASPTGSDTSNTSRFSALLPPSSASPTGGPGGPISRSNSPVPSSKRVSLLSIYDRPLTKGKGKEVNLSAFAFLFAETVRYTQSRVDSIGDLEKKLNILGYHVGVRLLSLTILRDTMAATSSSSIFRSSTTTTNPARTTRLLPALSWVHTTLWRVVVGKVADALERSNENPDEYMISDNDLLLTRSVAIPPEMSQLSCGAIMAGIVEAAMDGMGFASRVTSHAVPSAAFPKRTTILIKLEPHVVEREAALDSIK